MPGQRILPAVKVPRAATHRGQIAQGRVAVREHALEQRHVAKHANALGTAERQDVALGGARGQAVREVVSDDRHAGRERLGELAPAEIAYADVPDLSRSPQLV